MTLVDQSLAPVRDALIARIYKVLSLDVFDTLMWRKVPDAIFADGFDTEARVQGENKAMAAADAYRDECVRVLERHRGVVDEDLELLSERVIYKKMMSVGLGKLITKSKRPIMKLISYNHDKGRYEAQDQNT